MANPNLINATSIFGKTIFATLTTSLTSLLANAAASNTILKVNSVMVTNTSSSPASATLDVLRSGTGYPLCSNIVVPERSAVVLISKDSLIYLEEGDTMRISGSVATVLRCFISYEIIS